MTGDRRNSSAPPHAAAKRYDALIRQRIVILAILGIIAFAAFLLDLATGPSDISTRQAFDAMLNPGGSSQTAVSII